MRGHRSLRVQITLAATLLVALVVWLAGLLIAWRIATQDRAQVEPRRRPVFSFHDPVDGYDVSALLAHEGFVTFGTICGAGVVRIALPTDLT